ncbi:MAG: hypothetical protein ACFFDW_17515, partial [Candidatus Thorarchaeota archaeon]
LYFHENSELIIDKLSNRLTDIDFDTWIELIPINKDSKLQKDITEKNYQSISEIYHQIKLVEQVKTIMENIENEINFNRIQTS